MQCEKEILCSDVKMKEDTTNIKATKRNGADDVIKEECKKEYVKCKILHENGALMEVMCDMLVSEL